MTFAVFGRLGGNAQVAAHVDGRILQRDGEEEMDHEYSAVAILAGFPPLGVRRLAAVFGLREAAARGLSQKWSRLAPHPPPRGTFPPHGGRRIWRPLSRWGEGGARSAGWGPALILRQ